MGCVDSAILLDCSSLEFDVIDLGFADHGMELLVVDTGVRHAHATGGYAARRASCELASRALGLGSLRELAAVDLDKAASVLDDVTFRRVRHVVGENQRVLDTVNALQAGDLPAVGSLLTASHISLRDDYEVSVPELDAAVAAALHGGSVGARMTGGGFGGSVIAIIQSDLLGAVSASIRQAFTDSSFQEPTIFVVTPSAGAQRDC